MSNVFLPDSDQTGRTIEINALKPDITEIDEAKCRVKVEGLAIGSGLNEGKGVIFELALYGNQILLPRDIYNIKIIIEEA